MTKIISLEHDGNAAFVKHNFKNGMQVKKSYARTNKHE